MDSVRYEKFIGDLRQRLESDARVRGLILLGSTADQNIRDELSDHDFWIIAEAAAVPEYSDSLAWLPNVDQILLAIRHAPVRRTVLYKDRHKIEYAVFDSDTAKSGKIERFRVEFDRGGVAALAAEIRTSSIASAHRHDGPVGVENLFLLALSGLERVQRGEILSAQRYVQRGMLLAADERIGPIRRWLEAPL